MRNKLLLIVNAILAAIISALGFSSCEEEYEEYGCPSADFYAEGYVLDEDGTPIEGITVKLGDTSRDNDFHTYDSINSDSKGNYLTKTMHETGAPYTLAIIAEDENGVYANDTVKNVKRKQVKKGDGDWYDGTFKYSHTFHLKKKEQ